MNLKVLYEKQNSRRQRRCYYIVVPELISEEFADTNIDISDIAETLTFWSWKELPHGSIFCRMECYTDATPELLKRIEDGIINIVDREANTRKRPVHAVISGLSIVVPFEGQEFFKYEYEWDGEYIRCYADSSDIEFVEKVMLTRFKSITNFQFEGKCVLDLSEFDWNLDEFSDHIVIGGEIKY